MQIFSSASRRPCGGRHDATRSGRPSAWRADGSWSSIHLGNAPKPRRRHPPFGATFTGGGLLVGSDESGVEHQVLVIRIAGELGKNPLPDARLCPAREALVHALPFAISLGQFVPLCPGSQHPKHAVDEQAIVLRGPTGVGLLARQHPGDTRPLPVIELVPLRHALCSESIDPKRNQSEPIPDGNPECRLDLVTISKVMASPHRRTSDKAPPKI